MSAVPEASTDRPSRNAKRLQSELRGLVGKAIADFQMIENGDRVMVCLSGGKDSYTLLDLLLSLQRSAPLHFELIAVNLDQKQPGFPEHVLPDYLRSLGVQFHIIEQDTYSVVKRVIPEGKTLCSLCSRLRRGALYRWAGENGITKIALGHHRDDILETLFLNLFHGGKLKAMPPKLLSDDRRHIVIRPLAYVTEAEARSYAQESNLPIIGCCCSACGDLSLKRQRIKRLIAELEVEHPEIKNSMMAALGHVVPSHLLDRQLSTTRVWDKAVPAAAPREVVAVPVTLRRR